MPHALKAVLVLAALVALPGCFVEGRPNGKREELFINASPRMARHLENVISLPGQQTFEPKPFSLKRPRTFTYDFKGTRLDIQAKGIDILGTELVPSGGARSSWRVRIRCQAPHGQPTEFSVRVMDGDEVQYEDAIDITCWEPEELKLTLTRPSFAAKGPSRRMLQGGPIEVLASLYGTTSTGRAQLSGSGLEVVEPSGSFRLIVVNPFDAWLTTRLVFRAEGPGKEPLLRAGPVTARVPIEVVPNEGWTLDAWTEYGKRVPGTLQFAGHARFPDGVIAVGLDDKACTFTLTPTAGKMIVREGECTGYVSDAPASGELCVEAFGQKACSRY
jgi:hypothetical protein